MIDNFGGEWWLWFPSDNGCVPTRWSGRVISSDVVYRRFLGIPQTKESSLSVVLRLWLNLWLCKVVRIWIVVHTESALRMSSNDDRGMLAVIWLLDYSLTV